LQNGTSSTCYDLLGFTASGILFNQLMVTSSNITSIQGTILPINTWAHVAVINSSKNVFCVFIKQKNKFIHSKKYSKILHCMKNTKKKRKIMKHFE